jgi:hypothetical protein
LARDSKIGRRSHTETLYLLLDVVKYGVLMEWMDVIG